MKYLKNILIAIDQFLNAVFAGDPDETISSRLAKRENCRICYFICTVLNFLDKDHCKNSIELDEGKDGL